MYRDFHAIRVFIGVALLGFALATGTVTAQQAAPKPAAPPSNGYKPLTPPPDYVIGPDDILTITVYGQDPTLHSGDVIVRPDGKISRLLIDEVHAAGLTPLQLKAELTKAYSKFFQEPMILVQPKQINSRKVGISGMVFKSGEFPLNEPMDILQLITRAGGLQEYADKENIRLIRRHPDGKIETIVFNYKKVFEGKGVTQVPQLKPGDQVLVR
jgi:polysaccharide export outer membrane protein